MTPRCCFVYTADAYTYMFPKGEFLYASLDKWGFVWDWREMRTKNQAWIAFQLYASLTPPARFTSKSPYLL